MPSSNTFFRFKQFIVHQERTAMKVGTDGVLLGALAQMPPTIPSPRILDIGTGTGLVAIMLAQRFPTASVMALEIDPDAAAQAVDNCDASPFASRLHVVATDANTFTDSLPYDLIVSNPPYFSDSLQCPDGRRTMARHTVGLDHAALMQIAARLLAPHGRIAIILPADATDALISEAVRHDFSPVILTTIFSNRRKPARRSICQFARSSQLFEITKNELTLLNPDGSLTSEYKEVTRDFYLDK